MMLFDFLKKIFGYADEGSRKRRADDSLSLNEDFGQAKRRRNNSDMGQHLPVYTDPQLIPEEDDEIKISAEPIYRATYTKKLSNGTRNESGKGLCCPKPAIVINPLKKCTPLSKRNDSSFSRMGENSNPNTSSVASDSKCSTLIKTQRLREKKKYGEMLRNFVPHRIQILNRGSIDSRPVQQAPEVIDLEKYEPRQGLARNSLSRPPYYSIDSKWLAPTKIKERITSLESKYIDPIDRNLRKFLPETKTPKEKEKEEGEANTSTNIVAKISVNESIVSNSLRDRLACKAVIKDDYIPQVSMRYNARIEERNKEAEELKRMTELLSKQNRLAREAALEEQLAKSMRLCEAVLDDREEPEEAPLPVLTPQMLQEIKNALIPHPPNQVLAEGFGLQITRKDIHTLSGLNWLNDEVINFYMNLLIVRGTSGNFPKVHVMNTFFYPKLLSGGHSSLKRWTRKVDIFSKDLLVVPIHLGMHWCMSVVDFREKTIRYFDSMGGSNPKCLNALKQYLQDESLDKKKQPYDVTEWKLENVKDIPQQMNGSDCGVFSCMFAEYISGNKRPTFSQKDMPYFRKKMVYEILKSKLL